MTARSKRASATTASVTPKLAAQLEIKKRLKRINRNIKRSDAKRGGARKGAGRPKGAVAKIDKLARLEGHATGETPLQFMLRLMRDDEQPIERRMAMAVSAAPYMHAKYTAVAYTNDQTKYDAMVRKIERVIIDHDPKKFEATFSDITDVETEESRKLASTVGADTAASRAAAIAGNNHTPHPANAAD